MTESRAPFRRVFRYDDGDQLVAVEDDRGWRVEFAYDANGNRLRCTVAVPGTGPSSLPPPRRHWPLPTTPPAAPS